MRYGRDMASAKDREVRLSVTVGNGLSALQQMRRSLVPPMVAKPLFPACTRRWWETRLGEQQNNKRFKRAARSHTWLDYSGDSGLPGLMCRIHALKNNVSKVENVRKQSLQGRKLRSRWEHPSWLNCRAEVCLERGCERWSWRMVHWHNGRDEPRGGRIAVLRQTEETEDKIRSMTKINS